MTVDESLFLAFVNLLALFCHFLSDNKNLTLRTYSNTTAKIYTQFNLGFLPHSTVSSNLLKSYQLLEQLQLITPTLTEEE